MMYDVRGSFAKQWGGAKRTQVVRGLKRWFDKLTINKNKNENQKTLHF